MDSAEQSDLAATIASWNDGDHSLLNQLIENSYDELRTVARTRLSGHRLQNRHGPTSLVHRTWDRLSSSSTTTIRDPERFFGYFVRAMERVLLQELRSLSTRKRGAGFRATTLSELSSASTPSHWLELRDVLSRLRNHAPRQHKAFVLHLMGDSAAVVGRRLGCSQRSAERLLHDARKFLATSLASEPEVAGQSREE